MANFISEDKIEQATIQKLVSQNGYVALNCFTQAAENLQDNSNRESKKQVVLSEILKASLIKINPTIPEPCIQKVVDELSHVSYNKELVNINYQNYQFIKKGIPVDYEESGKEKPDTLKLIDFINVENNTFTVVSQLWIKGEMYYRRPDLIIYVNGLPVVFIELKNSIVQVKNAYDDNLQNYLKDIPQLFSFNQICVLSNGTETRMGSFSAGYEHYFEWLKKENEKENPNRDTIREKVVSLEYLIEGLLKKDTLLDYIENFILHESKTDSNYKKIIAKNHQYLGVNNAFNAFVNRKSLKGKLGVFWHTQGSGKSYSMVLFAQKVKHKLQGNFTFLIVTDRTDLDTQIWKNFWQTGFMSKEENVRPSNSLTLREELKGNKTVLFTLIHKFRYDKGKQYPILSERDDIIVIVDEAHRTQYKDLAENMRKGLPNAQFIAFTGTPLLGAKRLTNSWFGDYVSEYNFAQSIKDKATVPLYYVNAMKEVQLQNAFLDEDLAEILEEENLSDSEKERLENTFAKQLEVIKRDDRLEKIARHIAYHFPRRGFLGKGMVVSVDKFTAVKMYDKVKRYWQEEIKSLNVELGKCVIEDSIEAIEKRAKIKKIIKYMQTVEMAVVISSEDNEEKKFAKEELDIKIHRGKMESIDENGKDIEDNFKDPNHPLQLVFVCSMWLTGFDAPSVSTLYLDKPMKNHTLMQAIARANRIFPGKESGIVLGYMDVFQSLKKALADYAADDADDVPVKEIEQLYNKLLESIELTKEFCKKNSADLDSIANIDDIFENIHQFDEYANRLVSNDDIKNEYRVLSNTVNILYESLKPNIFQMDFDATYKEIILYLKDTIDGKIRPEKIEKARQKIRILLDQSVLAHENPPQYGTPQKETELLSTSIPIDLSKLDIEKLKESMAKSKYKNLEITELRSFINKKLEQMIKQNKTRISFAERFRSIIEEYNAGGAQNEDFYEKLMELIGELKEEESRHIKEDLTEEELELFDLLKKDKLTKDEEKRVKLAAKELYTTLTNKKTELFIVGWVHDAQPKERVKKEIQGILNEHLPESYDRTIFANKTEVVFTHIVDQALQGIHWVA